MEIVDITENRLPDINKANEPFEIIGKLVPTLISGKWSYSEELFSQSYTKVYPSDDCDYSDYIGNSKKTIFLAYDNCDCIGQIILKEDWNRYAFIEDICIRKTHRGQSVGSALIQKAIDWAKGKNLCGLALETQDNNLLACRFYAKCGFSIGAVNTMLYKNFDKPWSDETAIFWYLRF